MDTVLGIIIGFLICMGMFAYITLSHPEWMRAYKQGQLDYSVGKVKYHWVPTNSFEEINYE